MAEESEDLKPQGEVENPKPEEKLPSPPAISFPSLSLNIWPPSQRTREAVTHRLVETLSSNSVLSKRYGTIPHDEASAIAVIIEKEAFAAAGAAANADEVHTASIDGGLEILELYSKEISNRVLSAVKAKNPPPAAASLSPVNVETASPSPTADGSGASEEISAVESETPPA